jgi:hypothetical protein
VRRRGRPVAMWNRFRLEVGETIALLQPTIEQAEL